MQNLVETPGDFSDLLYAYTVANVPCLMHPGYIQTISWYTLDEFGCIWKESKER
jgi:hypothetical protein